MPHEPVDALLTRLRARAAEVRELRDLAAEDAHEMLGTYIIDQIDSWREAEAWPSRDEALGPKLSVGRVVHYYSVDGQGQPQGPLAAFVVSCDPEEGVAELEVFWPLTSPMSSIERSFRVAGAPQDVEPRVGYWMWPPRV